MRPLLIAINAVLVLAIVGVALFWHPEPEPLPVTIAPGISAAPAIQLAAVPTGGDFTLTGPQGPVNLHDFAGKVVLLYFGYTYCPDICPTSLVIWKQAFALLTPAELAEVQPLFVSVDPERDTVARLKEYGAFFHPKILGITGAPDQLTRIAASYGAVYSRHEGESAGGYVVDHTALTYLIDRQGKLVASLPHALPPDQLVAEIRKVLSTR